MTLPHSKKNVSQCLTLPSLQEIRFVDILQKDASETTIFLDFDTDPSGCINSLERTKEFSQVTLVLPAHGHPFTNLVERTDDIIQHHVDRLQLIRETGDSIGEASVNDYMKHLFKERSWGDMAASETYAHLEHLRILGEATPKEEKGLKTYKFA